MKSILIAGVLLIAVGCGKDDPKPSSDVPSAGKLFDKSKSNPAPSGAKKEGTPG